MSVWFPQFATIKDFGQLETQAEVMEECPRYLAMKTQNNVQTTDNEDLTFKPTRSYKLKTKGPQISFEENFMVQHKEAFDFYVQGYIEQMFDCYSLEGKNFLNESIFPPKLTFTNGSRGLQSYLKSEDCPLSLQKAQIFMEDLTRQEKLYEFLVHVCSNCCDEIAFEILLITHEVWQRYLQVQHQQFTYQSLIEYSKNMVEYNWAIIKNQNLIHFLTFDKTYLKPTLDYERRQAQQKKFIEFLVVTLFLVASEYFRNPYYQEKMEAQLKRHIFFNNTSTLQLYDSFSQSEDSGQMPIFSGNRKKRK